MIAVVFAVFVLAAPQFGHPFVVQVFHADGTEIAAWKAGIE